MFIEQLVNAVIGETRSNSATSETSQNSPALNVDEENPSVEQLVNTVADQNSPALNVDEENPAHNRLLSPDVILEQSAAGLLSGASPFSGKRGLPHWFQGKVAASFSTHIFYPEPPKKTKTLKLKPTQLFTAYVSTKKWRDLHVEKVNNKTKPMQRSVSGTQKVGPTHNS